MEEVSQADLISIRDSKTKMSFLAMKAEKAILEAQLAEVEHKNNILSLYLKYKLSTDDMIDEKTGKIVMKEKDGQI